MINGGVFRFDPPRISLRRNPIVAMQQGTQVFPFKGKQNFFRILGEWPYTYYTHQRPNINIAVTHTIGPSHWMPRFRRVAPTVLQQHEARVWIAPPRFNNAVNLLEGDGGPTPPTPGVYDEWWYVRRRQRLI